MKAFLAPTPRLKLFGAEARRVSTQEMQFVVKELDDLIGWKFGQFELVKSLACKESHGDIDILAVNHDSLNIQETLAERLGDRLLKFSVNANIYSFLYNSSIGKVHIDLIISKTEEEQATRVIWYSFNDFSSVVCYLAKVLYFKFSTEGFFKRYRDRKGNWHDIPITMNLLDGLTILGLDATLYSQIQNYDDITNFVIVSPLVDSVMFDYSNFNSHNRGDVERREGMKYILGQIAGMNLKASNPDPDYFFKKYFPEKYQEVEERKREIDEYVPPKSKFRGEWLISKGIKPGPKIGRILNALYKQFGDDLENQSEEGVWEFTQTLDLL